jgi:hypothetical protein
VKGKFVIRSGEQKQKTPTWFCGENGSEAELFSVRMNPSKRLQLAGIMDYIARTKKTEITKDDYIELLEKVSLAKRGNGNKNITKEVEKAFSELTEMAATRVIFRDINESTGKVEITEYPLLQMGKVERGSGGLPIRITGLCIGEWFSLELEAYRNLPKKERERQNAHFYFLRVVEGVDIGVQAWFKDHIKGKKGDIHISFEKFASATGLESSLKKNLQRTISHLENKMRDCLESQKDPASWELQKEREREKEGVFIVKRPKKPEQTNRTTNTAGDHSS